MAVVIFHFFPNRLPGGFIGVDIFFVISGYLITGIIAKQFEQHRFSIWDFYQRRIRRIFPALSLILAFSLIVGWLTLFPSEYEALGKYVAAGAGFVENFALWTEAGYFDGDAIGKPLLHLWSLAIEEQFYLLWPLLLWFIMRRRWPLLSCIGIIATVSFIINIWYVHQGDTTAAFYSPWSRAWELMAGAWLGIAHRQHNDVIQHFPAVQSWLGLGMIAIGVLIIRETAFPGFWALLPIIGTVLVINAGADIWSNQRLLSNRLAVWIGLISYPLYLWHWLLWSMTHTAFDDLAGWYSRFLKLGLIVISILFAWLTYRFVEQPIRKKSRVKVSIVLLVTVALLGTAGLATWMLQGVKSRPFSPINMQAQQLLDTAVKSPLTKQCSNLNNAPDFPQVWSCNLGTEDAKEWIAAYGDSHASSMIPTLDKYGKERHLRIVYTSSNGCLMLHGIFNERKSGNACQQLRENIEHTATKDSAKAIILIQRWSYYIGGKTRPHELQKIHLVDAPNIKGEKALEDSLAKTADYYSSKDIPVILAKDSPQQQGFIGLSVPRFSKNVDLIEATNTNSVTLKQHLADQAVANLLLENTASKFTNISIYDPTSAICWDGICPWAADGKMLYADDDHLSLTGVSRVYPIFEGHLDKVLLKKRSHH